MGLTPLYIEVHCIDRTRAKTYRWVGRPVYGASSDLYTSIQDWWWNEMMFFMYPDGAIEENVREGLTNELVYYEHREVLEACRKKAKEISDGLTPKERRFICEMKATSIILPFSESSKKQKHLKKGEMVSLVQLIEVIDFLKQQKLGHCIGCVALHIEMERDKEGKLIVHASSSQPGRCEECCLIEGSTHSPNLLQ